MSIENTTLKGGWVITQGDTSIEKHPDALAAFEKASAGYVGVKFTPVDKYIPIFLELLLYKFICSVLISSDSFSLIVRLKFFCV